ncbi:TetR family transcriptional regulator [Tsuneonella flava]|uniref:TetR family transcriptional regulator n=1 Tax=Tsuneonella flava TaxID=2055955 RepID=A0ABX7K8Y1_9SPHN|nr:TetR family transcriptional regulator [Tsuneonella flava]QSB44720.1 TetR family transcriptional regulator [Tsuneonella flava]
MASRSVATGRARGDPANSESAQQLVQAAIDLMRERDTLDVSFVDIAERAGHPQGLIGYYFGNKQGLLVAALERSIARALAQLESLLAADYDPVEKMRMHLNGIAEAYFRFPFFNRLLQAMVRDGSPEEAARLTQRLIHPMMDAQATIIDAGVAQGVFRPVDKKLFYFATVGAADGLNAARFILGSELGEEIDAEVSKRNAAAVIDFFLAGLLKQA